MNGCGQSPQYVNVREILLDNFKNTNAVLVKIDQNNYDLYISVTETAVTKIFNDSDKSNNLLRVANNVVV